MNIKKICFSCSMLLMVQSSVAMEQNSSRSDFHRMLYYCFQRTLNSQQITSSSSSSTSSELEMVNSQTEPQQFNYVRNISEIRQSLSRSIGRDVQAFVDRAPERISELILYSFVGFIVFVGLTRMIFIFANIR